MHRWVCVWMLLDASSFHSVSLLFPSSPLFQQSDVAPVTVAFTFTLILIRLVPREYTVSLLFSLCGRETNQITWKWKTTKTVLYCFHITDPFYPRVPSYYRYDPCTIYPSSHDWWVVVMSHTLPHSSLPLFGIYDTSNLWTCYTNPVQCMNTIRTVLYATHHPSITAFSGNILFPLEVCIFFFRDDTDRLAR